MTEPAEDQGWRKDLFDLHAMLAETKRLVDEAREARLSRSKDEWKAQQ